MNGEIGEVQSIKMKAHWVRSNVYFTRNNWAGKIKAEGQWILDSPANNAFSHFINIMCFFAGENLESSALIKNIQAELYRAMPIECCDTCFVRAMTVQDIPLHFCVTHASGENAHPEIEVIGSKGSIRWTITHYAINKEETAMADDIETGLDSVRCDMFNNVIDKLNGKDVPVCSLDNAYAQTLIINAMHMASTIHDIPKDHYNVSTTSDGEQVKIKDIESIFQKAFEEEKLPSELGIQWAKASAVFDCEGLSEFTGPKN